MALEGIEKSSDCESHQLAIKGAESLIKRCAWVAAGGLQAWESTK
jgi:hypothetical protein